jgi:hypothetical protein
MTSGMKTSQACLRILHETVCFLKTAVLVKKRISVVMGYLLANIIPRNMSLICVIIGV